MIRFMPDDWLDVVMRPFDMVAPDANTYVEIAAPDLRMAAAFALSLALALCWRRRTGSARAVLILLAALTMSFVPWFTTTGNGRYFIAWLILLGPLCLGLIRLLPVNVGAKWGAAGLLIAAQAFLLSQQSPWDAWSWVRWKEAPFYHVDPPPAAPATYVTISSISYSLIAPSFPRESRWMNLTALGATPRDSVFIERVLRQPNLILFAPALPKETDADGKPSLEAVQALEKMLERYHLSFRKDGSCSLLRSRGLGAVGVRAAGQADPAILAQQGFWLCPVTYQPRTGTPDEGPDDSDSDSDSAAFEAVERLCPRFFRPGEAKTLKINGGLVRQYGGADTKVYVLDSGEVLYKFWRSINPVTIGTREEILAGSAAIDCSMIRAPNWRRGGP